MSVKTPLVLTSGEPQQLQSGDTVPFMTFLASGSVSAQATMDIVFTTWFNLYSHFKVVVDGIRSSTTTGNLLMRVSADGSTWDSAAASYAWTGGFANAAASPAAGIMGGNASDTSMTLNNTMGNAASKSVAGFIMIYNAAQSSLNPAFTWDVVNTNLASGGSLARIYGGGARLANQVTKGIRLLLSTGNITGNWRLYGMP